MIAAVFQAWMVVGIAVGVIAIFALMILDAKPYDDEGRPILDEDLTAWEDWEFPNQDDQLSFLAEEPTYWDDWGYDGWEDDR